MSNNDPHSHTAQTAQASSRAGGTRVLAPSGSPVTFDDLPPANTTRWVTRRKAAVVAGVRAGLLSLDEACQRYALSVDEFLSWQRRLERHGLAGLRTTRTKEYRRGG